jgi:voltage-gated potassium channel
MDHRGNLRRLRVALLSLVAVVVAGTVGYVLLGFSVLDALYQTVTTVATVGFREVEEFGNAEKVFTLVLITVGVGTVIYTFTMVVEMAVEGHLGALLGRTRMDRRIASLHDHVVVCGLGRVGRAIARDMLDAGRTVVVVDHDEARIAATVEVAPEVLHVLGDATHDATLHAAGIERAGALVAALADDAENLFVTLSGRALRPELFIVTRAREEESVAKLQRAGADQVVNPQELGARQMATSILNRG